jgi:transcriptional regulator with XRE-family HTH domain
MYLDKKDVAKIIQNARRKAGLKQSELAEKIGISEKHLSKIETGKNFPALDNFFKIIEILNLSLSDFGISTKLENYPNKIFLQKVINTSSEKQLEVYCDLINTLQKYV